MLSCFLFTAFFVYIGGRAYPYYAFILTVFSIYGFAMLPDVLKKMRKVRKKRGLSAQREKKAALSDFAKTKRGFRLRRWVLPCVLHGFCTACNS